MYMWRAVDGEGEVLEILVQPRRDKAAAVRLLRKLLRRQGFSGYLSIVYARAMQRNATKLAPLAPDQGL
jgi:transposase-like protein